MALSDLYGDTTTMQQPASSSGGLASVAQAPAAMQAPTARGLAATDPGYNYQANAPNQPKLNYNNANNQYYNQGNPNASTPPLQGGSGVPVGGNATGNQAYNNGVGGVLSQPSGTNTAGLNVVGIPGTGGQSQAFNTYGNFGTNIGLNQQGQASRQAWGIQNDVNYGDYQQLSTQAQQQGAQAGTYLNSPAVQQAIAAQTSQANAPSSAQSSAMAAQAAQAGQMSGIQNLGNAATAAEAAGGGFGGGATQSSLSMLQSAAQGNGPTAADIQQGQGISAALRSQLSAAASARGGAYAQAAAQEQAQGQMAQTSLQGANAAAQLRAQELQAAQAQYAQAAGQAYSTQAGAAASLANAANAQYAGQASALNNAAAIANQQYGLQTGALQGATQSAVGQQNAGLQYYEGQQNAYQTQAGLAAQLAQNQIANDYGLSGTSLQTQTQQNIANQQQTAQYAGAGMAAAGMLISAAAAASTGGAEAAAKGARDAGAPHELAARIGARVGQRIGDTRGIRTPETERADAKAAAEQAAKKPRGMTEDEARAHLAMLRKGRPPAAAEIPRGARYEPAAPAAYQAGSQLAQLAARYGRAG